MAYKAPGKHFRQGLSVRHFFKMFPDDKTAEEWFIQRRWPDEIGCPHCGSVNVQTGCQHKTMPFRCREKACGKWFSVKTGTFMQSSKLGYQTWLFAMYLICTSLKSVSSMKLHRDLEVTQKTAWFLAHRIREAWTTGVGNPFGGPVEVDETYIGGKRRNMSHQKRKQLTGRGPVGKTAVVGMKDRATKQVSARVVEETTAETLQGFVHAHAHPDSMAYTDDASAYASLERHETVKHSLQEYVRGPVHTNGVESFWSLLKRAYTGTFHRLSERHLHRYIGEFVGRHNMRDWDTLTQMSIIANRMIGKRLRYQDLVG